MARRQAYRLSGWLAVALVCLGPVAALAGTQVHITAMHPADGSTLATRESFYVRMEYTSDEPVRLWARPFYRGQQVRQSYANASASYTGSGTALGWFALSESGDVDEVRVSAGGGKPYREWEVARVPVSLHWSSDATSPGRAEPAWVDSLRREANVRMAADAERAANAPVSATELVLFNAFMLVMFAIGLAGFVVPLWTWWKWRGGWRVAAAVPAALVLFVALRIAVGVSIDPTSHNLWPFEILTFSVLALGIVGVLKIARRFMGVQA